MIEDVEFLLEKLKSYATFEQVVVSFNERLCKIKRDNYFPDESGKLVFHSESDWSVDSYSVAEMIELLERFGSNVTDIKFQSADGTVESLVNIFEVDNILGSDYYCLLLVGDKDMPMKIFHNPDNVSCGLRILGPSDIPSHK